MTDLQNFVIMLAKADGESFTKEKSGSGWVVETRGIRVLFHEDESYYYMSTK